MVNLTKRQRATTVVLGILVAGALVVGLSTNRAGSACPQPCPTTVARSGTWCTYTDSDHGFAIGFPGDFVPRVPGDKLAAPGAVVTFVPTFDPSVGKDGLQTNLGEVSVTVAMANTGSCPQQEPLCLAQWAGSELSDTRIIEGRAFTVTLFLRRRCRKRIRDDHLPCCVGRSAL